MSKNSTGGTTSKRAQAERESRKQRGKERERKKRGRRWAYAYIGRKLPSDSNSPLQCSARSAFVSFPHSLSRAPRCVLSARILVSFTRCVSLSLSPIAVSLSLPPFCLYHSPVSVLARASLLVLLFRSFGARVRARFRMCVRAFVTLLNADTFSSATDSSSGINNFAKLTGP